MLMHLSMTRAGDVPATDLGYVLHKHPQRLHKFDTGVGPATVFYPEANEQRCTATLFVEVDPIGLVRSKHPRLSEYVSDRPYAASSLLAVALGYVYRSALSGTCKDRPDLAEARLPLEVDVPVVPSRRGAGFIVELFEPLGYRVAVEAREDSRFFRLRLRAEQRVCEVLAHLFILLPVLDGSPHYYVNDDTVEKLLRRGRGWLEKHPARAMIVRRYLGYSGGLAHRAFEGLDALVDASSPETESAEAVEGAESAPEAEGADVAESSSVSAVVGATPPAEAAVEKQLSLSKQRVQTACAELVLGGARTVVDLGCGEGALLAALLTETPGIERVIAADATMRSLQRAQRRTRKVAERSKAALEFIQSAVGFKDARLGGLDAICMLEVIEHIDPHRLDAAVASVFDVARPRLVIVTTPNREYNELFMFLRPGELRHRDHRFEWTREEFKAWANAVATAHGYIVGIKGIGPEDAQRGTPTQMAVFARRIGNEH